MKVDIKSFHFQVKAVFLIWVPSDKFGTWQTGLAPSKVISATWQFSSFQEKLATFRGVLQIPSKYPRLHHFGPISSKIFWERTPITPPPPHLTLGDCYLAHAPLLHFFLRKDIFCLILLPPQPPADLGWYGTWQRPGAKLDFSAGTWREM